MKDDKKNQKNKTVRYICRTEPKMKNSRLFTKLFQWSKRCAPEYGGKNKSSLLAEKKPAYGRIKIPANNSALNSVNRRKIFSAQK